jgi:2'-deoxynucleoside 5'-phosphate N-hydrolase
MTAPSLFHSRTDLRKLRRFAASVRYAGNMKIYFGFTVAGDRSAIDTARRVVRLLEELGHEVLTRHLISDNAWEADRSISPQDVFHRDMAWLEQCDRFIAEVSGSSFGLGFETGYLLGSTNKKVVLLFRRELEKRVSLLISGNTHPNCTLVPYTTIEDAEQFIASSLGQFHNGQRER